MASIPQTPAERWPRLAGYATQIVDMTEPTKLKESVDVLRQTLGLDAEAFVLIPARLNDARQLAQGFLEGKLGYGPLDVGKRMYAIWHDVKDIALPAFKDGRAEQTLFRQAVDVDAATDEASQLATMDAMLKFAKDNPVRRFQDLSYACMQMAEARFAGGRDINSP